MICKNRRSRDDPPGRLYNDLFFDATASRYSYSCATYGAATFLIHYLSDPLPLAALPTERIR